MKEEKYTCDICHEEHDLSELTYFDDSYLCADCLRRETFICRDCGDRHWNDDSADGDLCQTCYDEDYIRCTRCDAVIHYDDACYYENEEYHDHPYCRDCFDRDVTIHDYYYKPEPIFYGDNPRYLGVELELDDGGEDEYCASKLLKIANAQKEHMYIKHDGSLDDGFECVTHPMTLDYHINKMSWRDILNRAVADGYRSHQAGTCGLHVHISRNALGANYEEQEATIAKILYFYEKFWNEILTFSRRTESQVEHWARRYGGGIINPKETLKHAKNSHMGRYAAVNLENEATIEMRIFRGTLKYSTFIATLQMVDEICKVAISLSDEFMQSLTWLDFVKGISDEKTELINYLKEKRLYVNEPIRNEVEI